MSRSDDPGVTTEDDETTPAAEASTPRRKWKAVTIAAVAVLALAVAGLVVYLLTRGDDAADANGGPTVPSIGGSAPVPSTAGQAPPEGSTPTIPQPTTSTPAPAGGDAGAAQSVAEQAASAISSADIGALTQLACDPASVSDEDSFPPDAKVEVVGEPQFTGDTATVDVVVTLPGAEPTTVPMPLTRQDGRWCIP